MRLYRIIVLHGAPKDSHESTETYLVAENEDAVAEWISKEKHYGDWFGSDEDEPRVCYPDDDSDKEITFREWVMLNRGDLKDEEGWEDACYGVTKWGWEEVEIVNQEDIKTLIRLKIAVTTSQS